MSVTVNIREPYFGLLEPCLLIEVALGLSLDLGELQVPGSILDLLLPL